VNLPVLAALHAWALAEHAALQTTLPTTADVQDSECAVKDSRPAAAAGISPPNCSGAWRWYRQPGWAGTEPTTGDEGGDVETFMWASPSGQCAARGRPNSLIRNFE
jgi:hypothetical protein